MKIGILTQPLHTNYGGLLQNFALQKFLRDNGHEPITLDWSAKQASWWRQMAYDIKCWFLWKMKKAPRPRYRPNEIEISLISQNTSKFIEKYINHTDKLHNTDDFLQELNSRRLQALIAGSDQVWRPKYSGGHIFEMFFAFAENLNIKRIAYAASFGTDRWEFTPSMTDVCAGLAKKFDLVTIRETSGVKLCREHLLVEAKHVLDPTMLLCKEDYENLVKKENEPESEGTLFHYILDPSAGKITFIEKVARNQRLKPFTIMPKCQAENRTRKDVKKHIEDCVFPSVTSWLRGFMDAKMVIVDSFHGAVFSIIFNKPFWVMANAKRGNARFDSLLSMFGLEDRMITPGEDVNWSKPIDWAMVNEIRQNEVVRCKKLLAEALK